MDSQLAQYVPVLILALVAVAFAGGTLTMIIRVIMIVTPLECCADDIEAQHRTHNLTPQRRQQR